MSEAICRRVKMLVAARGVKRDPVAAGLCRFYDPVTWLRAVSDDRSRRIREDRLSPPPPFLTDDVTVPCATACLACTQPA